MRRKKKAQSILEYIIVLSAIVVAVIAASEKVVKPAVAKMFDDSGRVIQDQSSTFLSRAASNSNNGN